MENEKEGKTKINKKMVLIVLAAIVVILIIGTSIIIIQKNSEESKKIEEQRDADMVASSIVYSVTDIAPWHGGEWWSLNERIGGSDSGYAIVSGDFEREEFSSGWETTSIRTYDTVYIEFFNFCSDEESYPKLSGEALINGTFITPSDSGQWILVGTVDLSGKYSGTVDFVISIKGFRWTGYISVDGTDWDVSSL